MTQPTSQSVRQKIQKVRGKHRDIDTDNLTTLEKSILGYILRNEEAVTVKDIAGFLYGDDVAAEARGKDSVRKVRNALRVPKAMGLVDYGEEKGSYVATKDFKKRQFDLAVEKAAEWKKERQDKAAQRKVSA